MNLGDCTAATGLVTLFVACDFEIGRMTLKIIGQLSCASRSSAHYSIAIVLFKLEPSPRKAQIWQNLLWPLEVSGLTLTFCTDITFVHGNYRWKFRDDKMRGTLDKRCGRYTDKQMEIRTDKGVYQTACSLAKNCVQPSSACWWFGPVSS